MGLSPLRNRGFNWGQRLLVAGGVLIASISSSLFVSTPVAHAAAGINQQMNFQGRLYTNLGNTVADGFYNIEFNIYQDGAGDTVGNPGGTLKWTEDWLNANSQGVQVKNGFLSVQLGSINPFGTQIDWNQDTLWLSMNIAGTGLSCTPFSACSPDGEMIPMKRMSATAYALNAQNANTLNGKNAGDFIQNTTSASLQTDTSLAIQSGADAEETAYLQGRANQSAATLSIKQGGSQTGLAIKVVDDNDDPLLTLSTAGELAVSGDSTFSATLGIGNAAVAGDQLYVKAATGNVGIQVDGNGTEDIASFRNGTTEVVKVGNEGQTTFQNSTDSTSALNVKKSAGTGGDSVLNVDTTNGRIGVNNDTPGYAVDVTGDVNIDATSAYKIDGTDICTAAGCTPASGSSYYIQNTTSPQTANIAIISDVANPGSEANASLLIKQALGQTGDLLRITDNNDVQMGNFDQYGNFNAIGTITGSKGLRGDVNDAAQTAAIIRQLANAATAPVMIIKGGTAPTATADLLQLQNSNADRVAGFDKDGQLLLGNSTVANGSMKLYNNLGSGSITIQSGNTTGDITLTLPTALGNSGDCLKASDGSGALGFASCSNGVDTIGTFDGNVSYDNGAQISGTTLTFGAASDAKPGLVSTIAQTFAGDKTFVGKIISQNTTNSTNALSVMTATSGTNRSVLNVDTTNERVTVGAPSVSSNSKLDVYANTQTSLRVYQNGTNNVGEFSATSRGVGTVDINGTTTLSGTGTKFLTTLGVGSTILVNSTPAQLRTVTAIASDTSLTVGVAFSGTATGLTFNVGGSAGAGTVSTTAASNAVSGSGTTFTTSFRVGDSIAINDEGVHVISTIASDTALTLADNAANTVSGMAYARANFDPLTIKPNGALGVNTLSPQAALHVQSPGVGEVGLAVQAAGGQTANLFNILDATGTVIAKITKDGDFESRYITSRATINAVSSAAGESALVATQNAASATAPVFVVKNTGATPTATADLIQLQDGASNPIAGFNKDGQLYLGRASNNTGSMKFFNSSNANTVTIQSAATTTSYTLTLPLTAGSATDCLQNDGTTAGTLAFGTCGVKTIDTLDNVTKSANGAVITGNLLTLQSADNTYAGLVTSGASTQTMGINKTFQNSDANGDSATALTVKKTAANGGGTVFNVDTSSSIVDVNGTIRANSGASQTTDTGTFKSNNTTGVQTNGVNIDRTAAGGTTTNGLNISQTAGTLTNGLAFTGTIGTDINRGVGALSVNGNTGINFQTGGTATTAGTTVASLNASGAALFKNSTDSGSAFQVQNTAGTRIFNVDSSTNTVSIGDSTPYAMRLPGAAGAYASTPDSAANSVSGDFEIVMRLSMTDWTPSGTTEFFTKYNTTGNQVAYRAYISSAGNLHLVWSANGSTIIDKAASTTVPFTDGQTYWVRFTLDVDNGASGNDVKFYTAADSTAVPTSWTQLGSTQTTAGVTSVFDSNVQVEIGSRAGGSTNNLSGTVYRAMLINGLGGTTVQNFNPAQAASTASTTFAATTGETWTRNGTATFLASTSAIFAPNQTQILNSTLIKPATDAADAFMVQNSSGNQIITVDTVGNQLILGKASTVNGKMTFASSSGTGQVVLQAPSLASGTVTLTLPSAYGASGECLKDSNAAGVLAFGNCISAVGNLDAVTKDAKGAAISGNTLYMQSADNTVAGLVTSGASNQTLGINKTFQNSNANGDSANALTVKRTAANGGTTAFNVDTSNASGRVSINSAAAATYELEVGGTARFTTSAIANTSVLTPLVDAITTGPLGIGTGATTNAVNIGSGSATTTIGGVLQIQNGTNSAPGLAFNSQATLGIYKVATDVLGLTTPTGGSIAAVVNGNQQVRLNAAGVTVASGGCYNFSGTTNDASAAADASLCRDGANAIGQRNGTNAQTLSIYNTYTNASNYERANIGFSSNTFNIDTQAAGTGTVRGISIGGTNATTVSVGGVAATTVNIGAQSGTATVQLNLGTNNTAGSTTNVTLGAGSSATGGTTQIQSKGNTTIATNGTTRATFDTSGNLYLGNGTTAGSTSTFTIRGTGSSTTGVTGGTLNVQGGAATVGNANGGDLNLMGGNGFGTGVTGLVTLGTPTFYSINDGGCYTATISNPSALNCNIDTASVNGYSQIIVGYNALATGKTASLPNPTNLTAGRLIYITVANGSADFTLQINTGGTGNLIAMRANTTATMIWNGGYWTAAGASSSTTLQAAYENTLQSAGGAELVVSKTSATNGLTIRDSLTNSVNGALLSVQSKTAANLLSVSSNVTDYASNPGAETIGTSASTFPASTWGAVTGATVSRNTNTTNNTIATGQASVSVVTTTSAGSGVSNQIVDPSLGTPVTLAANNHYNVSFSARLPAGAAAFTDLQVLYQWNATAANTVTCASSQAIAQSVWTKINCSFTAPSSGISTANIIRIEQTGGGTSRTFYVDNLSVTIAADYSLVTDGGADVSGGIGTSGTTWNLATAGSATASAFAQDSSDGQAASTSVKVTGLSSTANAGIRNKLAINPLASTLYRITVYAKGTTTFNDFKVRYSATGAQTSGSANYIDCVDYNTQSISTSAWTKVTCYITTDTTSPTTPYLYFVQTAAASRTFSVDTASMTLAAATTPNVQVGSGANGGPTTLFTLDRGASAPIAGDNESLLGSMYYDTTLGKLQCYEADGWGACGSSPDNIITISPEYTNAVMHGTGVGTMTSDICSDFLDINDPTNGPQICNTNETYNFYRWTSPQASAQAYSIYVTYQLPGTFKSFTSGSTSLQARVDSLSNAFVKLQILKNHGGTTSYCGGDVTLTTVAGTWQAPPASGTADPSTCGFVANDSIAFKITVSSRANANAFVGNLNFTFNNN